MPLHLFLVHFPVALLLVGAAADLLGTAMGSEGVRRWATAPLILGALAALLAFLTGESAAAAMSRDPETYLRAETHSQWGGVGVWLLVAGGVLRAQWRGRLRGGRGWAALGVALLSALLVVGISLSGSAVSHG